MACRRRGGPVLSGHAIQTREHAPAARQRVIDGYGLEKSLDGLRCLLRIDEAAPPLLMEAAEVWVMPFDGPECVQRLGSAAEMSLGNGHVKQNARVLGRFGERCFARRHCLGVLPFP